MPRYLLVLFLLATSFSSIAQEQNFNNCIVGLQTDARQQNIPDWVVDEVLPSLKYQERVIELDRAQPEFTQTFANYFNKRVTSGRIDKARTLYRQHGEFLNTLTEKYGVPGQYLIAFWGLETNFGSYLGKMPTLDVLATLACDQRRSEYFGRELITALKLLEREQLLPSEMKGSWAGAMGHTQFMPSAYMRFAIDGDNDGKIDLWKSPEDALASAANFLKHLGWQTNERWGREVKLPKDFPYASSGLKQKQTLDVWTKLGVTRSNGLPLPNADMQSAVLVPLGHTGPAFLVYDNFSVIMRWNYSESYAIAVGHLADRTVGGDDLRQSLSIKAPSLSPQLIRKMQQGLNEKGFDAGKADGIIGSGTRAALRDFQSQQGLVADGFPGFSTFTALNIATDTPLKTKLE